jgi:hypothetical protein
VKDGRARRVNLAGGANSRDADPGRQVSALSAVERRTADREAGPVYSGNNYSGKAKDLDFEINAVGGNCYLPEFTW